MAHVIIGTAGHIDHGKSALVRALTGTDPDRLPEEKQRGITLDLGYAFLDDTVAIIDVPGHERLIRNMVAGASTVDFALLVVAADDGIMPQTIEHLQILQFLGIRSGAVVITKIENADPDWIALVKEQIGDAAKDTFLESAPVFMLDSLSGRGIPEFREALRHLLSAILARKDRGVFRLPIDRVFSMKGRGTVVTGTILSGRIENDARLTVLPGGFDVRVKRLETQGKAVAVIGAGQRAALNLVGDTDRLERGKTLAEFGTLLETTRARVVISLLRDASLLKDRQRIRMLIGTQEVLARIKILYRPDARQCYADLLLEEPAVAAWGDRFILRRYSPMETLGGGRVLDPNPPTLHAKQAEFEKAFTHKLDTEDVASALMAYLKFRGQFGIRKPNIARLFALDESECDEILFGDIIKKQIAQISDYLLSRQRLDELVSTVENYLAELHKTYPDRSGFARSEVLGNNLAALPDMLAEHIFTRLLDSKRIAQDGPLIRKSGHEIKLSDRQTTLNTRVHELIMARRFSPPSAAQIAEELGLPRGDIEKTLVLLERLGICSRLGTDLFFDSAIFEKSVDAVRNALAEKKFLAISDVVQLVASSRKFVVPFLEHLDSLGITMREGNIRIRGPHWQSEK